MASDEDHALDPIPLVVDNGSGKYECHAEGLHFLRSCSMPLAVIVVAGRYRTGKSFLLNRGILQLPVDRGFTTGSTVNACTKGLWAYPKIVRLSGTSTQALILDSEGTGSSEGTPAHDAKLISIALALASVFVFNSVGALDEACFSEVGVIAHAAQMLQRQSHDVWQTPDLVWVLRDFSLLLQNPEGVTISPNAYLEQCLSEKGKGEARELLRTYFEKRSLFTLVRPVADEENLRRLNSLNNEALRPEFVQELTKFHMHLCTEARVKTLGGHAATGSVLAHLCLGAIQAVNDGSCPCVSDSLTFLLELDLGTALKAVAIEVRREAQNYSRRLPCPPDSIKLRRPSLPDSLVGNSVWSERFFLEVENMCENEEDALAIQNTAEQARWVRDFIESAKKSRNPLCAFECFMRTAHETVGVRCAHDSCLLMYETCVECERRCSANLIGEMEAIQASEAAQCELTQKYAEENDEIRVELNASLMTVVSPPADLSEMLEAERKNSDGLLYELGNSQSELEKTKRLCESISCDLAVVLEERDKRRLESAESGDRTTNNCTQEITELKSSNAALCESLKIQEETEKLRFTEMQQDMMQILEDAKGKFAGRHETDMARVASEEMEVSTLKCREKMLSSEEKKEREAAQELRTQLARAEKEHSGAILQLKRRHTEQYAEKSATMRENHEHSLLELQKAREKVVESERTRVRLEIESQVNKRACESHKDDLKHLAKTRRCAEDLRERLVDREASARTSSTLLEESRRQILELEDVHHKTEAAHGAEIRKKEYKVAMLEFQLQALAGGAK
uniref:GB1/RHD3-type G domain-containing protein n=1 Tax=viral metagenome TaxID=1070528 RepID=A0A6C0BZZ7_9ZZZZ